MIGLFFNNLSRLFSLSVVLLGLRHYLTAWGLNETSNRGMGFFKAGRGTCFFSKRVSKAGRGTCFLAKRVC